MENSTLFTGCCLTCFAFYLRLNRLISSFKVCRETLPFRRLVVLFHGTQVIRNLLNLVTVVDEICPYLHVDSVIHKALRNFVVFHHSLRSKCGRDGLLKGFHLVQPGLDISNFVFRRYHDPAVDEVQV